MNSTKAMREKGISLCEFLKSSSAENMMEFRKLVKMKSIKQLRNLREKAEKRGDNQTTYLIRMAIIAKVFEIMRK